jgi:tyrosine-protein phosphatase SIW14
MTDNADLLAPENFALVEDGVYRSSFPRKKNCPFLRTLGLKTVISLVPEAVPDGMVEFYESCNTALERRGLEGNKWPFKNIDRAVLQNILNIILNPARRPLLIHCNKGKHRTGSVVGCLRRIRGWSLSSVFNEYILYAYPKCRLEDQQLIESFEFDETAS